MHVHSRNNSRWTIPAPSVSFVALSVALFLRDLPEFAIALSSTSPRLPLSACDPSLEDQQEESDSQEEDPDRSGDYRSNSKNSRVKSTLPQSRWTRSQGSSGPAGSGTQQHVATLNSGLPLCIELVCSEPSIALRYASRGDLLESPRFAHRIRFIPPTNDFSAPQEAAAVVRPNPLLTPPSSTASDSSDLSPPPLRSLAPPPPSPPQSPESKASKALALPSNVYAFLRTDPWDGFALGGRVTLPTQLSGQVYDLVLEEVLGTGRTSETWKATGFPSPVVVKIVTFRYLTSVARESLFYELFPRLRGLDDYVPKYYGTFVGGRGGWYAIVLEDCGTPVSEGEDWPDDSILKKSIRDAKEKLLAAGITHGDIRPANVLTNESHAIRIIDFGEAQVSS